MWESQNSSCVFKLLFNVKQSQNSEYIISIFKYVQIAVFTTMDLGFTWSESGFCVITLNF